MAEPVTTPPLVVDLQQQDLTAPPAMISQPTLPLTVTATSIPADIITASKTVTPDVLRDSHPGGFAFGRDDILVSHTSQGLEIRIDEIRILDREAAIVETYLDQPLLWEKKVIVEIAYALTNSSDIHLVESSPWSVMVFGDAAREQFEVVRLADYHAITPDGIALSPGVGNPEIPAGETQRRFLRVGLNDLAIDAIDTLQWVFACPTTRAKNCYGSPTERYETIVDIAFGEGQEVEWDVDLGLNITPQAVITHGGVEVHLARLFSAPIEMIPEIKYRSDLFDASESAIFLEFEITNHADFPRFLLPEIGYWMMGDTPQSDFANVIHFAPFFRDGLAFSSSGYYPHLNPVYKKILAQTPLVLQPGDVVYLGVWLGSELEISPGQAISVFLGCAFPLVDNLDADDGVFPDCLSDEYGETYHFKLILPDDSFNYDPYPIAQNRIAERQSVPLVAGIAELPTVEPCQDAAAIAGILRESIPEDQWGIQYRDNRDHPPELVFYGVSSGETSTLSAPGSGPNSLYEIDLVQLDYLDLEGQLQTIWMATGVTTERQGQQNYVSWVGGVPDRQDVFEIIGIPGQFFEIFISNGYVEPDGVAWERCYRDQAADFFDIPCEIGLFIEEDLVWESQLGAGGKFSTDLAYGWIFNPQGNVLDICPKEK